MKINFIFGKSVGALTGVFLLMSLSASAFGDSQPDCESSSTTSTVIRVVKEKTRRSLGGISELMKANRKEYSDVQQKLEEVISKIKTGEDEYKERGRAMDLIRSDGGKRDKYNRSLDEAAIDALKALDFIKKAANEERESLVNKRSRLEVEFQELKALNETSAATKYKLDQIRIGAVDKDAKAVSCVANLIAEFDGSSVHKDIPTMSVLGGRAENIYS